MPGSCNALLYEQRCLWLVCNHILYTTTASLHLPLPHNHNQPLMERSLRGQEAPRDPLQSATSWDVPVQRHRSISEAAEGTAGLQTLAAQVEQGTSHVRAIPRRCIAYYYARAGCLLDAQVHLSSFSDVNGVRADKVITLQTCFINVGALLVVMHTLVACLMQQMHHASNRLLTAE